MRFGKYFRQSDQTLISRYRCRLCKTCFSSATYDSCYRQKKRHINQSLSLLLVSGVSQRRAALILGINQKTVVRKFVFLGVLAKTQMTVAQGYLARAHTVEFDDLETFEHTKCKPLSVTLAVESKTRRILCFEVSRMPAKGRLAALSRKKYGPRRDERPEGRKRLFEELLRWTCPSVVIKSDQNPHYLPDVRKYFPDSEHQTFKGRRGCIVGQGELKKIGFDPLFSLNHTCAMLRADINRLFRRTWCTTKRPDRLALHIALMANFHNSRLAN